MRPIEVLGKVGLDRRITRTRQEGFLKQVLNLRLGAIADHTHPWKQGGSPWNNRFPEMLKNCPPPLPDRAADSHTLLHRGGLNSSLRWRAIYLNCYFGFTGLGEKFCKGQREALLRVPSDWLLLKSDAQYMPMLPGLLHSSPAYVGEIAQLVLEIRQETIAATLSSSLANGRWAYRTYSR